MPGVQAQGGVSPQDQRQLLAVRKAEEGVDGVRGPVPLDLAVVCLESIDVGDRQPDHLQPVGGTGQGPITLLPRLPSRHEQDSIEAGLVESRLPGVEMSQMDRVEGPSEDPGVHDAEDRAREASPIGGHD